VVMLEQQPSSVALTRTERSSNGEDG
jgi:hypothetical protein